MTADPTARLIPTMPAREYHADPCPAPSLSSGIAKILLAKSPRAAWFAHSKLNPNAVREDESKFDIGTSAHAMLLEGDSSGIVVVEADDWRTKAAREARDAAHAAGKTALLARHADDVRAMVDVAKTFIANSEIAGLWDDAKSEQTIIWQEQETWLRTRLDRLTTDRRIAFDYKTTGDASPDVFLRQIPRMGYHIQESFYRRSVRALGHDDPRFVFLAQEVEAPYDCALYGCEPGMQAIADAKVDAAISKWRTCLATGNWHGYSGRVHWCSAPAWLQAEAEGMLTHGI